MKNITSSLIMKRLVFNKIEFNRKGIKSDQEIEYHIEVQISCGEDEIYRVTLILTGEKDDEYDFTISLSGFFVFDSQETLKEDLKRNLINKNAVAILMPYLRSEVSLLTAQPGMECIVLPPFNINKMLEEEDL